MEIMQERPGASIMIVITHCDEIEPPKNEDSEDLPTVKPVDPQTLTTELAKFPWVDLSHIEVSQVSAKTGEGLSDLLLMAAKLGQATQYGHEEAERKARLAKLELERENAEKNVREKKAQKRRGSRGCTLI